MVNKTLCLLKLQYNFFIQFVARSKCLITITYPTNLHFLLLSSICRLFFRKSVLIFHSRHPPLNFSFFVVVAFVAETSFLINDLDSLKTWARFKTEGGGGSITVKSIKAELQRQVARLRHTYFYRSTQWFQSPVKANIFRWIKK